MSALFSDLYSCRKPRTARFRQSSNRERALRLEKVGAPIGCFCTSLLELFLLKGAGPTILAGHKSADSVHQLGGLGCRRLRRIEGSDMTLLDDCGLVERFVIAALDAGMVLVARNQQDAARTAVREEPAG